MGSGMIVKCKMASEICDGCGLPQELCACTDIDKNENSEVPVTTEERQYGKVMTIVKGVHQSDIDEVETKLKSAVGAGGNIEDGKIQIQGDHTGSSAFEEILQEYNYEII